MKHRPTGLPISIRTPRHPGYSGFHLALSLGQNLEKTKHNVYGISKAGQLVLSGLTRADGAESNTEQPASERKSKLLLDAFSISSQTPRRKGEVSFFVA